MLYNWYLLKQNNDFFLHTKHVFSQVELILTLFSSCSEMNFIKMANKCPILLINE